MPLVIALLCWLFLPVDAQTVTLELTPRDFEWSSPLPPSFPDTAAVQMFLREWRDEARSESYWEASVDSVIRQDSFHYRAVLHRGPAYRWGRIVPAPDIPRRWLGRAGFRLRAYRDRPLDHWEWLATRDSLVSAASSEGYPFARAGLDSLSWLEESKLSGRLWLERGAYVRFGRIEVPEQARIDPDLLARLLGIEVGGNFDRRLLKDLPRRIEQLPYLRLTAEPVIVFRDDEAIVRLPVERKAASRFDFVIGVLPRSNQTGRLLITGELKGELVNGFGQGERIAARFEQLRPQTQELQLAFAYPHLLGLPFGLDLEGELYRRDTQFLNLGYRLAATYRWRGNNRIDAFWQRRQTNLLGFDEARVVATGQLPDTLDVSRSFFGLSLRRRTADQTFNPRRGYALSVGFSAGNRRIRRNGKLLDLGLAERYDSLDERSIQYQFQLSGDLYRPFLAGTVFYLGLRSEATVSEAILLANEQYRLGGAQLLRGFDEQQLFASAYAVVTTEIRLLLGRDAYLYGFGDFGWIDPANQARPDLTGDFPMGFGAGLNFSTQAGVFGLSLAVGRRNAAPVDFGAPKVHFGYFSVF